MEEWPRELRKLQEFFQFTDRELTQAIQVPIENFNRWMSGERKPSDFMQGAIRNLMAIHLLLAERHSAPESARAWLKRGNPVFAYDPPRTVILGGRSYHVLAYLKTLS